VFTEPLRSSGHMRHIILKDQGVRMWTGFSWLRVACSGVIFQHSNKIFWSFSDEDFLE
jgi:hypothetical protein